MRNDRQHYNEGFFVFDIPTFNEQVSREAVLNAVAHRNYQLAGSIFIRQYSDRLVIKSPGGFPPGISLDNILTRQSPRNRRVAQILALCGLVERARQGMNLMFEMSIREAKALPDFNGSDPYYVFLTLNGLVLNRGMLALLQKIGDAQIESLVTEDFLIIDALYHEQKLKVSLNPYIKRLVNAGIIERTGRNKYLLARRLYDAAGKPGTHTRLVGLDRDTNKGLLVKHIKNNNTIGTPLKELYLVLPSHSRSQIQVLFKGVISRQAYSPCRKNVCGKMVLWRKRRIVSTDLRLTCNIRLYLTCKRNVNLQADSTLHYLNVCLQHATYYDLNMIK